MSAQQVLFTQTEMSDCESLVFSDVLQYKWQIKTNNK